MMRNGILLAEDTPRNIMQKYGCSSLEDAFLILCQKQGTSEEADVTLGRVSGQRQIQNLQQQHHQQADLQPHEKEREMNEKDTTATNNNTDAQLNNPVKRKIKRNFSFQEQKPDGLLGKLTFTSQIRMKALLTKNILQLVRQPA